MEFGRTPRLFWNAIISSLRVSTAAVFLDESVCLAYIITTSVAICQTKFMLPLDIQPVR